LSFGASGAEEPDVPDELGDCVSDDEHPLESVARRENVTIATYFIPDFVTRLRQPHLAEGRRGSSRRRL